jgi:hypothetical protein
VSHDIAQAGLKLAVLMPQPPELTESLIFFIRFADKLLRSLRMLKGLLFISLAKIIYFLGYLPM